MVESIFPSETSTGAHQPLIGLADLVHAAGVRRELLETYDIEIGAGLGVMAGKAWRIGLMGHGSSVRNVDLVLTALRGILR